MIGVIKILEVSVMPEHVGVGEMVVGCDGEVVTLESVVEDSLCQLQGKFTQENFVRVQRAMELAKEYLPRPRFDVYVSRYAEFMARYRVHMR